MFEGGHFNFQSADTLMVIWNSRDRITFSFIFLFELMVAIGDLCEQALLIEGFDSIDDLALSVVAVLEAIAVEQAHRYKIILLRVELHFKLTANKRKL